MKDDVNDEMPNGTSKTLILFDGVINYNGVWKLNDRLKSDHGTQFLSWI
jgi:hypothetical protein